MKDEANFRGGIRWGPFNATWPFARMKIDGDLLTFSYLGQIKSFRPEEITAVTLNRSLSPGVRLRHQKIGYPDTVIFWTWKPQAVLMALQDFAFLGSKPNP